MKTVTINVPEAACVRCERQETAEVIKYSTLGGQPPSAYVGAPPMWVRLNPDSGDLREHPGLFPARGPKTLVICPSCYAIAKGTDRTGEIVD